MSNLFRGCVKAAREVRASRRWRHSALYEQYMQSDQWRKLREICITSADGRCERCGASENDVQIEVHHLTYERLGREDPDDLQVLCVTCHIVADAERAEEVQSDLAYRRLDGWATKVYGPDWEETIGFDDAEEAFDEWLESRT